MDEKMKFRVLVIDDEIDLINSFKLAFADDWEVEGITDPNELERDMEGGFRKFKLFDLIFLDLLFDKSNVVTTENIQQKLHGKELLGIQFLRWLQENYTQPVVILSGNIFNDVAKKIQESYPYVQLISKPIDLFATEFRTKMEWYSKNFYKIKYEELDKTRKDALQNASDVLNKK